LPQQAKPNSPDRNVSQGLPDEERMRERLTVSHGPCVTAPPEWPFREPNANLAPQNMPYLVGHVEGPNASLG
jgi:hypothetical protein